MKKQLTSAWLISILLLSSEAIAAQSWNEIFSADQSSGIGTELTFEKIEEMSSPDNFYIEKDKKRFEINSIFIDNWDKKENEQKKYISGMKICKKEAGKTPIPCGTKETVEQKQVPPYLWFYSGYNANSGPYVFGIYQQDGKIYFSDEKKSSTFKIFKKNLNLSEIKTTGTSEWLPTGEGEGVQYLYSTPWKKEFEDLNTKLKKISTFKVNGATNIRKFIFTYKKGFDNYEKCIKNKKIPFCFKKNGENFILRGRAQLGNNISFWIKK